ncbi:MAG: hypothetical protein HQK81_03325 [Desulfovibrionaceae bacterium]|nr:hypothetical protein [Desulfovibrionaceae bacterium]MBF0513075.1 hypothetical protein [Desulfovibrionaceae bacterium]
MKPKCSLCKHWKGPIAAIDRYCPPEEILRDDYGYCKCHAPRPMVENFENARGKTFVTVWPETLAEDVCAEFAMMSLHRE